MTDTPTTIIIDVSQAAPPSPELAQQIREEALAFIAAGDLDKAANVMRQAQEAQAASEANAVTTRPLNADELAQRDTDIAAGQEQAAAARQLALGTLRAKRDRYLAQTDVLTLPDTALPTDMPQATKDQIAANRKAWTDYRQQLRDYIAAVQDPFDPPPFPAQPAAPAIVLT